MILRVSGVTLRNPVCPVSAVFSDARPPRVRTPKPGISYGFDGMSIVGNIATTRSASSTRWIRFPDRSVGTNSSPSVAVTESIAECSTGRNESA